MTEDDFRKANPSVLRIYDPRDDGYRNATQQDIVDYDLLRHAFIELRSGLHALLDHTLARARGDIMETMQ